MNFLFVVTMIMLEFMLSDIRRGVATYYTYEMYGGNHLYCSGSAAVGGCELRYTRELMENVDWVAVDIRAYEGGSVTCGDMLRICFDNGRCVDAVAWDAGPFGKYYIEDWPHLPILVDFEESAWSFSTHSVIVLGVINLSALERVHENNHPDLWSGNGDTYTFVIQR